MSQSVDFHFSLCNLCNLCNLWICVLLPPFLSGTILPWSTRKSKVGKCAAFQLCWKIHWLMQVEEGLNGSDFLKNTEEDFCLKQNKITDDHFCFMMKKTSSWSVEECFWLRTQLPPPVLLLLPTTKIMALNPCLSQEPSSANNLLYLALRSRILLILKKFYESVEYAEKIRPIILFDRT